jgi:pimeloyl-ACP methyl ester carboxylesterase
MDRVARGFAPVNGAQIYYERVGQGPAIVFIPPTSSDRRLWADQMSDFARYFTTMRYDLRGYGKSPRQPGVFRYAEDLVALLAWLGIERTVLVGFKLSADIALEVAMDRPELVTALVLIEPMLHAHLPRDLEVKLKQAGRRLLDPGSDVKPTMRIIIFIRALKRIVQELMPRTKPAKTWRRRRAIRRNQIIAYANIPRMWAVVFGKPRVDWQHRTSADPPKPVNIERQRRPYVYERLAEVQTPTLIVCSEYLFRAPWRREVIDELSDKLSNAVVARMPSSSGLLQLEYPKLFNVIVLDFLRDRLGRRGAGE